MNQERFDRIETLFDAALSQAPESRRQFVFRESAGDWELYREVIALLGAHDEVRAPVTFHDEEGPALVAEHFRDGDVVRSTHGAYRIRGTIGEGGMGVVYVAEQITPVERRVALKVLPVEASSERQRARFEAEGRALALMNHTSIAGIYEAGVVKDGCMFLAMEYVDGPGIAEYCDARSMSVDERLRLFARVCHGIQHAHQKGVIHRDLKPSNVLVTSDGTRATPRIIDFGVARIVGRPVSKSAAFTRRGVLVGSIEYMSPEQLARGVGGFDSRTDIYSLGVMFYELLTGVRPFAEEGIDTIGFDEFKRRVCHIEPVAPSITVLRRATHSAGSRRGHTVSQLSRQLEGDLDTIALKALEKDPRSRYQSAAEFAADIVRHLEYEPIYARAPSLRGRLTKLARRHRRAVACAAGFASILLVGLVVTSALFVATRRAADRAVAQRETIRRLGDVKRLEALVGQAPYLAPPHPEQIEPMERWLEQARDLVGRRTDHRTALRDLETRIGETPRLQLAGSALDGASASGQPGDVFVYRVLSQLVVDIERFDDPDPAIGTLTNVERRYRFARRVEEETITRYRDWWALAAECVADTSVCPAYHGLSLPPQVGLVPLGPDPGTGLWEFAHLFSGEPPMRDEIGRLIVTEETAIVLVLLPGRCFTMGALTSTSSPDGHVVDPQAQTNEGPAHRICLNPFFMSKYEVTQSQWERMSGTNASIYPRLPSCRGTLQRGLHPAEMITWNQGDKVTRLSGLRLPTEAQWEYAARAGTTTPWWRGSDPDAMDGTGNFYDVCRITARGQRPERTGVTWQDGYGDTSPVGIYAPNPFGLHDVLGNVIEWCADYYGDYTGPTREGDGLRLVEHGERRISRGSDFAHLITGARVCWRIDIPPGSRRAMGLRPARPLDQ